MRRVLRLRRRVNRVGEPHEVAKCQNQALPRPLAHGSFAQNPWTMNRRGFFTEAGKALLVGLTPCTPSAAPGADARSVTMFQPTDRSSVESASVTLFLCGDVMTGRRIDQILPHPGKPNLYEPHMRSALGYVQIAEQVTGSIGRPVDFPYIWGDALA